MNLAAHIRPKAFRDVVGQDEAVRFLRRAAQGGRQNVLFVGPSGCGKSVLAELYASSLLCDSYDGTERCGSCRNCQLYDCGQHLNLRIVDLGVSHDEAIAGEIRQEVATESLSGGWQVFIIDHVDRADPRALDILRSRVERTPPKVAFIMCAEDPAHLPQSLRTAVTELPIDFVGIAAIFRDLQRVARDQAIEANAEVLWLIAESCNGCVRAAIRDFEFLAVGGRLSPDHAQEHYGIPARELICSYLGALVGRDLNAQFRAIEAWPGTARSKGRVLNDLLMQMYVQARILPSSPSPQLLPSDCLFGYASQLTARARISDVQDKPFWQNVLRDDGEIVNDAQLLRRVCRLHEQLDSPQVDVIGRITDIGRSTFLPKQKRRRAPQREDSHKLAYLTEAQARKILAATSFMGQEYGVLFNCHISIRYTELGIEDADVAGAFCGDLTHELGQIVSNRVGPETKLHWVYTHGSEKRGLQTNIAAYVALSLPVVREWLTGFTKNRMRLSVATAPICKMQGTGQQDSIDMHASLVRLLCCSLDPACCVLSHARDPVSRLDALGVPVSLRSGSMATGFQQRYRVSKTIGPGAQRASADIGMPMISAWETDAPGALLSGWELAEHPHRRNQRLVRQKALSDLRRDFPLVAGEAAEIRGSKRHGELRREWAREHDARCTMWEQKWHFASNSK